MRWATYSGAGLTSYGLAPSGAPHLPTDLIFIFPISLTGTEFSEGEEDMDLIVLILAKVLWIFAVEIDGSGVKRGRVGLTAERREERARRKIITLKQLQGYVRPL